jgi:hypothetical protein
MVLAVVSASADVISMSDKRVTATYSDRGIESEYAVFRFSAPFELDTLSIWVAGEAGSEGVLEIYGSEGEGAYPFSGKPIHSGIKFEKQTDGPEEMIFEFSPALKIDSKQMFAGISGDDDIRIITDKSRVMPFCTDDETAEIYGYQVIITDVPQSGYYTYRSRIVGKFTQPRDTLFKIIDTDVFNEDVDTDSKRNASMAAGDINGDDLLDLFCEGKLYLNQGNFKFNCGIDIYSSISDSARYINSFCDVNLDMLPDLVILSKEENKVFLNKGDLNFEEVDLNMSLAGEPIKYMFNDYNADGFADIVVCDKNKIYFYENNGSGHFVADEIALPDFFEPGIRDFQINDINRDGVVDLLISYPENIRIYKSFFSNTSVYKEEVIVSGFEINFMNIYDVDNDGHYEIILSGRADRGEERRHSPVILKENMFGKYSPVELELENPTDFSGDCIFADFDNNGRADLLQFSDCNCRSALLHMQDGYGKYNFIAFDSGIYPVNLGSSGLIADMNNDGMQDIFTWYDNVLFLLENTLSNQNKYFKSKSAKNPENDITNYSASDVQIQELSQYYGKGNQVYNVCVTSLGLQNSDSLVVDNTNIFVDKDASSVLDLDKLCEESDGRAFTHSVYPNPVSSNSVFDIRTDRRAEVEISLTDMSGKGIAELYSGVLNPGVNIINLDFQEKMTELASGVYFYFIKTETKTYSGKIIVE